MMRYFVGSLGVLTALLISVSVSAEENEDAAKAKFQEGIKLFENEKYAEAARAFSAAYQMNPNWKLFYNIGQSEAAANHHGLALQAFEAYLSNGGDEIPVDRRDEVLKEVERLRKMVGAVDVKAPTGAEILIDGISRGRTPFPGALPIAASVTHKIVAVIDGVTSAEKVIQVMGGQTTAVSFEAPHKESPVESTEETEDISPATETGLETPQKRTDPMKLWGWIAVGVGGAVLASGAVTGGMSLSLNADLKEECDPSCSSDKQGDVDKRDRLALVTDILLPTGAVVAAVGVLMLTVFSGGEEEEESVALRPVVGPDGAGAFIEWRF